MNTGEIQISEVTTPAPSPFATDLLFGYVAEFMYATDAPLAERRASVLALDSELLGNLLGQGDPLELLDPEIIRQVEDELQRFAAGRKAQGMEGVYDLLRELGPMTVEDIAARHEGTIADIRTWLDDLSAEKRIFPVVIADTPQMACMDDAARLRDALGVRLPATISPAWLHPVNTPLRDLFMRFSRTHTLFTRTQIARAFGLGVAVADDQLRQLRDEGILIQLRAGSSSTPDEAPTWVNEDVFHRLRIRSLHAAREATRPVPATSYTRLLLERQGLISSADGSPARLPASSTGTLEGSDGVTRVIEQLAGVGLSASLWESQIFPARVRDYSPDMLDELLATGEVIWSGQKKLGDDDGRVVLHLRDYLAETLSPPSGDSEALSDLQRAILDVLSGGGAWFAQQLSALIQTRTADAGADEWITPATLHEALWGLVWQGYITTDIWAPLRGLSRAAAVSRQPSRRSPRMRRGRPAYAAPRPASVAVPVSYTTPALAGRWSLLPRETLNDTERMLACAENMLDRYGVIGRQAVIAENIPGGFPAMQTLCRSMEDSGRILRGRFVEGMGGAQFAERDTIDRLRDLTSSTSEPQAFTAVALSANDPANPWGTLLPWPPHPSSLVPGRRNGAFVVISAGQLRLYLAQGGKKMMIWTENEEMPSPEIFRALASALRREPRLRFTLSEVNDKPVRQTPLFTLLREVGFSSSPQGLDWG